MILSMLAPVIENHQDWESHLRAICMAYNTSVPSTTGQFPFLLMFTQRARIPVDMLCGMEWAQVTDGVEVGEYMAKQCRILQEACSYD